MSAAAISAMVVAAVGAAAAVMALPLGLFRAGMPGPGLFPFIAAASLLLTSIGVAFSGAPEAPREASSDRARLASYATAIAAFALMMQVLGTMLAIVFLVSGVLFWIEGKSWRQAVAAGLTLAFLSWWVFDVLLGVPLPQGLLEVG